MLGIGSVCGLTETGGVRAATRAAGTLGDSITMPDEEGVNDRLLFGWLLFGWLLFGWLLFG